MVDGGETGGSKGIEFIYVYVHTIQEDFQCFAVEEEEDLAECFLVMEEDLVVELVFDPVCFAALLACRTNDVARSASRRHSAISSRSRSSDSAAGIMSQ